MVLKIRDAGESSADKFLDLIADPFQTEVQEKSIYAAIVYSFVLSGLLVLVFCFLRPRNSRIYAPRAKHADEKHKPMPLGRKPLSWVPAIKEVKEQDLVDKIGLDAVLFLRFMRMLRNIFLVLTVAGCGILIPVNVVGGSSFYDQWNNIATLMKFTPQYIFGTKFWAYVLMAYIFQGTICFFLWWNYKAVLKLRRTYYDSREYHASLHSRTLLLTHIPKSSRTDIGITELIDSAKQTDDIPRTAIARNVKELPEMIEHHDEAVRELERVLAKYLSNPNRLPAKRPVCKVAKDDKVTHGKQKVDAIDYLTNRITRLETMIKEVRESVDMRNPMSFGFATYAHIEDAHAVAYAARKKGPGGCSVYLAPKPQDLLWQNLPMSRRKRRIRAFWDGLWVTLFTIAFIVPNMLTSIFLSNFANLGLVWPTFQRELRQHPTRWAILQGILAPLVQVLMYMGVPVVFRRLFTHSGDISKTSRERHVTARLYAFFVFNNLFVFSMFGSIWRFVAGVIAAQDQGVWEAIRNAHLFSNLMVGLCNVSTFWLTWQMQRNLGAAIDLSQAWIMLWTWIQKTFYSPTPRELIELSAPQPFPYADYFNNYLFVTTVGLCMGALQPIILPITAFYLTMDCVFKKYLLQYVFITKTESGGRFWRLLVNRLLFAVMLANGLIALSVGAQGVGTITANTFRNADMLYAMVPLPFLLFGFKWYCKRTFDDKMSYYSTLPYSDIEGSHHADHPKSRKNDRVAVRFGNPAIYKKLISPMVHAKSQHLLKEIYGHRLNTEHDIFAPRDTDRARPATLNYGDVYMTELHPTQTGRPATDEQNMPDIEIVAEQDLDFENFKKRAEFRDEFGGDGELYGRPDDMTSRPGTPSTFTTFTEFGPYAKSKNRDSWASRNSSSTRLGEEEHESGTSYAQGYRRADGFQGVDDVSIPVTPLEMEGVLRAVDSRQPLVRQFTDDAGDVVYFERGSRRQDTSYDRYRQ